MKYKNDCVGCSQAIQHEPTILESNKRYKLTLCKICEQKDLRSLHGASTYAIHLYYALKKRRLDAVLQYKEKFKTVDLCIPSAMLHIEVDGSHHNTSAEDAFSDLKRTLYSARDGFFTLRIPNSLIAFKLKKAIDVIVKLTDVRREEIRLKSARKAS